MRNILMLVTGLLVMLLLVSPTTAGGKHKHKVAVVLHPTPLAANAGLEDAIGSARVEVDKGRVSIEVDLGDAQLPPGTVLEGWVVDAGLGGGPGTTSSDDADEIYGTPFGDAAIDMAADFAAYALSTGVLKPEGRSGRLKVHFSISNNLTPYDAVVITLESDGNGENYDPRPGTPVLAGEIMP